MKTWLDNESLADHADAAHLYMAIWLAGVGCGAVGVGILLMITHALWGK